MVQNPMYAGTSDIIKDPPVRSCSPCIVPEPSVIRSFLSRPQSDMTNLPGDVQVEKRISARGREYTITRPAGAKPPGVAPTTQASSNDKEDFGIQVTWDTQGVLDWKPTTKTIQDTASISMYMLKKTSTSGDNIYCTLYFQNYEHYS